MFTKSNNPCQLQAMRHWKYHDSLFPGRIILSLCVSQTLPSVASTNRKQQRDNGRSVSCRGKLYSIKSDSSLIPIYMIILLFLHLSSNTDVFTEIQDLILKFRNFVFDNRRNCAILKQSYKIPHKWRQPCTSDDIWKPLL